MAAASSILHVNADKLDNYKINDNDGIIAMGDIPPKPPHALLIVNDTDDNNNMGSDDNGNDAKSDDGDGRNNDSNNLSGKDNNDKPADLAAATNANDNKSGSNQGV